VIPTPFLVILVLWLVIIFASFSLFSDLNVTVFTCLSLFALSASCAIFLILELSQPFSGLMMVGTLTAALSHCSSAGIGGAFGCVPGSLNRQLSVESSSTD